MIHNHLEFTILVTPIEIHDTKPLQKRVSEEIVQKFQDIIRANGDKFALDYHPIDHFVELIDEVNCANIHQDINSLFEEIKTLNMDNTEHRYDLFAKISEIGELQKSLPREEYTLCLMSDQEAVDDSKIKPGKIYLIKLSDTILRYAVFHAGDNDVKRDSISTDGLPSLLPILAAKEFNETGVKKCRSCLTEILQNLSGKRHIQIKNEKGKIRLINWRDLMEHLNDNRILIERFKSVINHPQIKPCLIQITIDLQAYKNGDDNDLSSLEEVSKIITGRSSFQQKIQKIQKFLADQKVLSPTGVTVEEYEKAKEKIAKKVGRIVRYFPIISENNFDAYQKRCRKSSLFSKSIFNDLLEEPEFAKYVELSFKLRMCFMSFKDIRGKLAHNKPVAVELIDSAFGDLSDSINEIPITPIGAPTIWSKINKSKAVLHPPSATSASSTL